MTTVNQNVETTDRIDILVTASSGTTVEPGAVTNCIISPQSTENSPFTYSISGFSGSSYTANFTDEVAGALQVTGSVAATGAWTSDKEQFTLRGSYGTKSLDLKYTAVKSKDGRIGGDGANGDTGLKSLTGLVYLTVPAASTTTPTATEYVFSTVSFSSLTANWSLERPTITAGNANNYWESTFNAKEDTSDGDISSGANLTFATPVRVQSGYGDSVTQNVIDINAASAKWVGVDIISFTEDSTNKPHPRSSVDYKYTYDSTTASTEFTVGSTNTDKSWTTSVHSFFAGDVEVAKVKLRHIAEPFNSSSIQQTNKVKSVYYELEVIGSPAVTYSTETNYKITIGSTSWYTSWVGGGSPTANGYDQIQLYDSTAAASYLVSMEHTPTKTIKTLYVSYIGVADSVIEVDGSTGGKS